MVDFTVMQHEYLLLIGALENMTTDNNIAGSTSESSEPTGAVANG
jgi:hypothetical protein